MPRPQPPPGSGGDDEPPFAPQAVAGSHGPASRHLLFFALLPPPAVAQRASHLAGHLRGRHGLQHKPMPATRMHITLQPVLAFAEAVPQLIIDAAMHAAAGIVACCRSVPITYMTLVYGTDHVAEQARREPIRWHATRLVLILSPHGLGHREVIEQWPLPECGH